MANKFIFKGTVKENLDPTGLGRIRVEPEDWIISDTKYITEYLDKFSEEKDKWNGVSDPFLFRPFLPNHINMVPQVGETVNIFYTDPEATFIDGFYMAESIPDRGYSDSSSAEHMLSQSKQGLNYKKPKDLIKGNGEYVKKRYDGAIPKTEDFVISSRTNSDVIWKDNAVIIRAGKLDEVVSKKQREPIRDENPAIVQVSKYDFTSVVGEGEKRTIVEKQMVHVNTLIEYAVNDLNSNSGFEGTVYIYKIAKNEGDTETIYFNQTTPVGVDDKVLLYSRIVTSDTLSGLSSVIRQTIKHVMSNSGGMEDLDFFIKHPSNINPVGNTPIYPLYFRPVTSQYESEKTNTEFRNNVLDRVRIRTRKGYGLVFNDETDDTPEKKVEIQESVINTTDKPSKNVIVLSDTNYILAYDNNVPTKGKGVDFSKVSNYDIKQSEVVNNIEPNTYALVRGEELHELLDVIYLFLVSHVHNPAEPAVVKPSVREDLEQKFQDFKQNILSQKIRIN